MTSGSNSYDRSSARTHDWTGGCPTASWRHVQRRLDARCVQMVGSTLQSWRPRRLACSRTSSATGWFSSGNFRSVGGDGSRSGGETTGCGEAAIPKWLRSWCDTAPARCCHAEVRLTVRRRITLDVRWRRRPNGSTAPRCLADYAVDQHSEKDDEQQVESWARQQKLPGTRRNPARAL